MSFSSLKEKTNVSGTSEHPLSVNIYLAPTSFYPYWCTVVPI